MKNTICRIFFALAALCTLAGAQNISLMPPWRQCFTDSSGVPLSGGQLFSYAAGTNTQQATYVDSTGTIENSNPVLLDGSGCAAIWVGPSLYKFTLADANGSPIETKDNVADAGQLATTQFVLLAPAGRAVQTILGPLTADYFQGALPHTTSPGVRVSIIDPNSILDTPTNPPQFVVDTPAAARVYRIYDPGQALSNFVMNPGGGGNFLDCSQTGITCRRTAYVWFEGGGCNNTTSAMGWDTFGTNSPSPKCVTGTNIQKGVLAFPSAVTHTQFNSSACAASLTCTTTYPAATVAGDLLEVEIAVDGSKTVSTVSDGTNAYTKAINKTQGALDVEIWYFANTSASMTAASTLTVTFSGGTPNSVIHWKEYSGVVTGDSLDKTASNSNASSTAVDTGTTAGTAQNTELVLGAVGAVGAAAVTAQSGFTKHLTVAQSTNVSIASEGKIQQTTTTQIGQFTLASAELWSAVIATFKANVAASITAQRAWFTPSFFTTTSRQVDSGWVWQAPQTPTGTVNVQLGAQLVCTAPGSTDDPTFLTSVDATALVSATGSLITTYTPLTALTSTGCAANNMMHLRLLRERYDPNDTYEGYVYLLGAPLFYGINQ